MSNARWNWRFSVEVYYDLGALSFPYVCSGLHENVLCFVSKVEMCHKWRSSARTYDLNFFSDAALYVVKLVSNTLYAASITTQFLIAYFSHFLFLKNSTHDPCFVYSGATVESEAYNFHQQRTPCQIFERKSQQFSGNCLARSTFVSYGTEHMLHPSFTRTMCPYRTGNNRFHPYPSNGASFVFEKAVLRSRPSRSQCLLSK
jgi:hypothetical protein